MTDTEKSVSSDKPDERYAEFLRLVDAIKAAKWRCDIASAKAKDAMQLGHEAQDALFEAEDAMRDFIKAHTTDEPLPGLRDAS